MKKLSALMVIGMVLLGATTMRTATPRIGGVLGAWAGYRAAGDTPTRAEGIAGGAVGGGLGVLTGGVAGLEIGGAIGGPAGALVGVLAGGL